MIIQTIWILDSGHWQDDESETKTHPIKSDFNPKDRILQSHKASQILNRKEANIMYTKSKTIRAEAQANLGFQNSHNVCWPVEQYSTDSFSKEININPNTFSFSRSQSLENRTNIRGNKISLKSNIS